MKKKRQSEVNNEIFVDWHFQAQEMLPELTDKIAGADCAMGLWVEIHFAFDTAYNEPRNDDLIRRIYGFANWCMKQPRSNNAQDDLFTCVIVCFYEDIPTNKAARTDMTRWFTLQDVRQNKEVFSYHLSAAEYEDLLALFTSAKTGKRKKNG